MSLLFYFVSEKSRLNYVGTTPLGCLKSFYVFLHIVDRKESVTRLIHPYCRRFWICSGPFIYCFKLNMYNSDASSAEAM